jgi:hypothetical protein
MGASAREIEQQIKETRERMDENLSLLETRAASGARRYGKIAVIVAGVAAVAGAGFLFWRKTRRPALQSRIQSLSPNALRALADEVAARLKRPLRSAKVTGNERNEEPGPLQAIVRKVAPAIVATASSALLARLARRENGSGGKKSARASSG